MARGKIRSIRQGKDDGKIEGDDGTIYLFKFRNILSNVIPVAGAQVSFKTHISNENNWAQNIEILNAEQTSSYVPDSPVSSGTAPTKKKTRPYTFRERPAKRIDGAGPLQDKLTNMHDRLIDGCFDIAFEVEWTAVTPIAANPCSDPEAYSTFPINDKKQYQGYDNRWLLIDDKLALSPFTVKSAVANGFATIMGSCYRVNSNIVKHSDANDPSKFNYIGNWKRYRVDNKNSKPGLLRKICYDPGEDEGKIEIQPVTEYYFDSEDDSIILTLNLNRGDTCFGKCEYKKDDKYNKKKILIPESLRIKDNNQKTDGEIELTYHGEYNFGMDLTLHKGELRKHHYHRFYAESGNCITGRVNHLNLKSKEIQEDYGYMGVFKRLDASDTTRERIDCDGGFWYQDLTRLNPDTDKFIWIYFQEFNPEGSKKVITIGKNFMFKTAFLHTDAVPDGQDACTDLRKVCPRCAMFGMTDESGNDKRDAIGFKGRFKSSVLVNNHKLRKKSFTEDIPVKNEQNRYVNASVTLNKWIDSADEIARQVLLPIQGQPKDSRRDVSNGYYNRISGMIEGAKDYLHFEMDMKSLRDLIANVNRYRRLSDVYGSETPKELQGDKAYNHELRNYAHVCREGEIFSGTLGAENCTSMELAALVMLLEHSEADHGYKIGLGKAIGLGSVISSIKVVWIRQPETYEWKRIDSLKELFKQFPGIQDSLDKLKQNCLKLNSISGSADRTPWYKPPGRDYYK